MTTLSSASVKCAVCGKNSKQTFVRSTNMLQSPDLDTRPGEMMRSTMKYWVQRCANPDCGYCAPAINELMEATRVTVQSDAYRQQLRDPRFPQLANSFLALSLIQEASGEYASAGWSSLQAAWACDDAGPPSARGSRLPWSYDRSQAPDAAAQCRERALTLFEKARHSGQEFAPSKDEEQALTVDLLRRSGRFGEAKAACDDLLARQPEDPLPAILNFQLALIEKEDTNAHTMEEATREPPESKIFV